jgi:phosphoribosyl 1,2-cyclic phosphodiesterase
MMRLKVWGVRGSIPTPGPDTVRYGGNTSCVQVTLSDGTEVVLDAGSGIRNFRSHSDEPRHIHLLLTHLHLDHLQGLLFFAPLFDPRNEVTIWGPAAPGSTLRDRIGRYMSAPLTPVELRELPCKLNVRECPAEEWSIGSARISAEFVNHRGPTLGYRITEPGSSFCYLPDHEPALIGALDTLDPAWISGYGLARDVDLLLHDCQYTDAQYPSHYGWGHSSLSDALWFAHRTGAGRTLLAHHDPSHSDDKLDAIYEDARRRWRDIGGAPNGIAMASELLDVEVGPLRVRASAP